MMTYAEMSRATRSELEREAMRAMDRVDELKAEFKFLEDHGFEREANLTCQAIVAWQEYQLLLNWALKDK